MRVPALVVALALIAGACSDERAAPTTAVPSTPAPAPAPTTTSTTPTPVDPMVVPRGWSIMYGEDERYGIGLPDRWVEGRSFFDDDDLRRAVTEGLEGFDLDEFSAVAGELIATEGIDFAFNLAHTDRTLVENLNILRFPAGATDDLELAMTVGPEQLEAAGATTLTAELISLPTADAAFITYRFTNVGVSIGHQYWVIAADTVYVLTFSGGEDADVDQWRAMIETFTPLP